MKGEQTDNKWGLKSERKDEVKERGLKKLKSQRERERERKRE